MVADHDFAPALLTAERRAMAIVTGCRAMKANSGIPVTIFVHQFESVPSIVMLAVLLLQSPRLASVAVFNGLLGMPGDGHALTFLVTFAQSFEPDRPPPHQNLTTVRRP
jgi:hypothetical protein